MSTTSVWDYGQTMFDQGSTDSGLITAILEGVTNVAITRTKPNKTPKPKTARGCVAYCDMDREDATNILFVINVIIIPSISVVGLFGNVSTILVLARQGMKKSSNILLMSVTVADLLYVLGVNNVWVIWRAHYRTPGHSEKIYFFRVIYYLQSAFMEMGLFVATLVTSLITLERLLAVFFPLRFAQIIRPWRTKVAVIICFLIDIPITVVNNMAFTIQSDGRDRLVKRYSEFYYSQMDHLNRLKTAADYISGFIPLSIILIGSILIGIKISFVVANRKEMMAHSGAKSTVEKKEPARINRTTITLLTICIQSIFTLGVGFCIERFLPFEMTWTYFIVKDRGVYILYTISSSTNFIIYGVLNKNFRETYLSILMPCLRKTKVSRPGLLDAQQTKKATKTTSLQN